MRGKGRIALLLFTALCCAAFAAYRSWADARTDRTAPTISVPDALLCISVDADDAVLLRGITAQDDRDGDVTASLLVERVSNITQQHRATVTVAAFDSAGNVAKASRTIAYTDYCSPRFTLSAPLMFREGADIDVFTRIGAQDVIDGSLNDRVKGTLVSDDSAIYDAGEYLVEFRVTNSLGDTAALTAPVEVYRGNPYNAEIRLDSYLIYLKKGEVFDAAAHLVSLTAGAESISLAPPPSGCMVSIASDVDTQTPGVYTVTYSVIMNQYKGCTRLLAVVED